PLCAVVLGQRLVDEGDQVAEASGLRVGLVALGDVVQALGADGVGHLLAGHPQISNHVVMCGRAFRKARVISQVTDIYVSPYVRTSVGEVVLSRCTESVY